MKLLLQSGTPVVTVGPFNDPATGLPVTGADIDHGDVILVKNNAGSGSAKSDTTDNAAHIAGGCYAITLNATDTGTLGPLDMIINISADTNTPMVVREFFMVVPANIYNSFVLGTDVLDVSLIQILGTALTETSGQIAAAFKKFFDKATPTGTINSIPDAVPGAQAGLLIPTSAYYATLVFTNEAAVTSGFQVPSSGNPFGTAITPIGQTLVIAGGTGAKQTPRVCNAWDNALRQGTVSPTWDVALDTDSIVMVLPTPPALTETDIAQEVSDQLDTDGVRVAKIVNTTLDGDGSSGSPWGPA